MPERSTDLAGIAARFASHLHAAGVEAGPDRAARFASTVHLTAPTTSDELYWLGRVTLTGDRTEIATYDRVFADVFLGVSDVAESRGDSNQPNLDSADPKQRRHHDSAPASEQTSGEPRPNLTSSESSDEDDDTGRESPVGAPVSRDEHLAQRDFAECTPDELRRLRELVAEMEIAPPRRASRRRRRHPSGNSIDRRASLRRARRTGGDPAQLVMRRPTQRRRRVVLLADVSGSMEAYSRAYLHLLHGAARALPAETFVFSTSLTRLTPRLTARDADLAMRAAVDDVEDWSGGTRIGEAIRSFNDGWGRRGLARGAVVVIVSDGWESDDTAELGEQMARLSRLAHCIIWVNPRAKSDRFQPLTGGMAAALPHVDVLTSGHSLDAFGDVIEAISNA